MPRQRVLEQFARCRGKEWTISGESCIKGKKRKIDTSGRSSKATREPQMVGLPFVQTFFYSEDAPAKLCASTKHYRRNTSCTYFTSLRVDCGVLLLQSYLASPAKAEDSRSFYNSKCRISHFHPTKGNNEAGIIDHTDETGDLEDVYCARKRIRRISVSFD